MEAPVRRQGQIGAGAQLPGEDRVAVVSELHPSYPDVLGRHASKPHASAEVRTADLLNDPLEVRATWIEGEAARTDAAA